MGKTVGLYIGHGVSTDGSWDSGCTWGPYSEAKLMKSIVVAAVHELHMYGVHVVTDAPGNGINMVKQVAKSNAKHVDLHVAVHCDYSRAPSGVMPLYVSGKGKKIAKCLEKHIKKEVKIKSRGCVRRKDLYELNTTNAPAVVIETGAIKADIKHLKQSEVYGKAIAHGIMDYIGVKTEKKVKKNNKKKKEIYRIRKSWDDEKSQRGAYNNLTRAKNCMKKAGKGYHIYDSNGKKIM